MLHQPWVGDIRERVLRRSRSRSRDRRRRHSRSRSRSYDRRDRGGRDDYGGRGACQPSILITSTMHRHIYGRHTRLHNGRVVQAGGLRSAQRRTSHGGRWCGRGLPSGPAAICGCE